MFKAIHYCLLIHLITFGMYLEIELDHARFLTMPGLAWQATLIKTKVKLDFFTDVNILLMVKKGIRGGLCHTI